VSKTIYDIIEEAYRLYEEGKYKEVVQLVDSLYGWKEGELERAYTKEEAEWCLKQL